MQCPLFSYLYILNALASTLHQRQNFLMQHASRLHQTLKKTPLMQEFETSVYNWYPSLYLLYMINTILFIIYNIGERPC